MKEEEPQVTLRRSNSSGAASPGAESPFQRAPRPNSQPPGSSESGQVRRSVREIRRSFEASTSVDSAASTPQTKPLASVRRSFHFERPSSNWEASEYDGRRKASNGEGTSFSPIKEADGKLHSRGGEGTSSKIPVRGGETKFQVKAIGSQEDAGNDDEDTNDQKTYASTQKQDQSAQSVEEGSSSSPKVSKISNSSNTDTVEETEIFRLVGEEGTQDVYVLRKNRCERNDYGDFSSAEIGGTIPGGKNISLGSPQKKTLGPTEGANTHFGGNSKSENVGHGIVSENRPTDNLRENIQSSEKSNGLGKSSSPFISVVPSNQKEPLSVIEASESLEKSKSQIDRLQSNLLPLSCETVNSLQSKLISNSSKSLVPYAPKAMPIPKSTSAPATMSLSHNGTDKSPGVNKPKDTGQPTGQQEHSGGSAYSSGKEDLSDGGSLQIDYNRKTGVDLPSGSGANTDRRTDYRATPDHHTDTKSKVRAQFFKTDVQGDDFSSSDNTSKGGPQKTTTTTEDPTKSQAQGKQPVSTASFSKKPEIVTRKTKPPTDLAITVSSAVSFSTEESSVISSLTTIAYPPSLDQNESQIKALDPVEKVEDKTDNINQLAEHAISMESTQTSYRLLDNTTTVASYKQNGNAQQDYKIKVTTTPRVVGVETKKGVEIPLEILNQLSPEKKTCIPIPTERKAVAAPNVQAGDVTEVQHTTSSEDKTMSAVSSPGSEEYRAFLLCARREEFFANEISITESLSQNGGINELDAVAKTNSALQLTHQTPQKPKTESTKNDTRGNEGAEGTNPLTGDDTRHTDNTKEVDDQSVKLEDESPKGTEKGGGKKIGFMMAVLGGLKDGGKKKKSPPKEVPDVQKPRREIKKRRGRVGPPLTEEEIKELEEETKRKKIIAEERIARESKTVKETKQPAAMSPTFGKVNEDTMSDSTGKPMGNNGVPLDKEENLIDLDDDDRSAVRRDAYAELLKKLVKTEIKKEDHSGKQDEDNREDIHEEDSDGSDTAVEEGEDGEYDYEDTVELRRIAGRRDLEQDNRALRQPRSLNGKPPVAPVPSVRTTSLTSKSISKAGSKSPTITVETVSPTQTETPAPSPLVVSPGGSRTGSESDVSGPRKRTIIETAFIGSDNISSSSSFSHLEEKQERQSAASRLLRTPSPQISPGQSRIPHTSLILEEKLKRRSTSAERETRRAISSPHTPTDTPVSSRGGGANSKYSREDMTYGKIHSPDGIFDHVDEHRPLKQCLDPPEPEKKVPAKTFLQRLLRQSTPPPSSENQSPHSHRSGSPRRQNPPRAMMAYTETKLGKPPLFAQPRDPRVASLPVGSVPPRGHPSELRVRSLSPPTTPSEYQAMQQYYQRRSPEHAASRNVAGVQRMQSPPPVLTDSRNMSGVRPQPVHRNMVGEDHSYGRGQKIPSRVQDPRSRSLSPQDAANAQHMLEQGRVNYFVRGSPVRTTIAAGEKVTMRRGLSAERAGSTSTLPVPIFKRGTITASSEDSVCSAPAAPKRVSFSSSTPTKAEREHMRMLQLREWQQRAMFTGYGRQGLLSGDDDVFTDVAPNKPLPPTPSAEEMEEEERKWLKRAMAAGARTPPGRYLEVSPSGISESESGSEAGEIRRIMRRRHNEKDDEWGADGKSRGLPGSDQPGGIPGSRGAVVGGLGGGGGSGDELEVRRGGGGGRPRRDEPRRHTLSHGSSVGGDEVHHHHHHHHHHRGGVPQTGSLARSMDLEMSSKSQRRKHNNYKMSDNGDAFLARMRRKVPLTSTPMAPRASPQMQYVRHQQRPPHPPMNTSLPGYGKTPLPRGSSGGSGNYYPPGMPTTGGGGHGTLDPRSVGHGGMMMGGGGMLYEEDDPGIMSEVETASTGFRRGGKQRSSLPVVRTPSKTLERPLGLVFLQYRNETKRALLPNEITSIDTVKALFVRSFPKQLSMEYLDSPLVKIYIHDSSKDMFYELEDLRSHLRDIRDRSVLRLFESDVNGGPGGGVMPGGMVGVPVPGPSPAPVPLWDQDQSYFSEPEFDSEYHHQHIHKTKPGGQPGVLVPPGGGPVGGPASSATLPRGPLLRAYSPATERIKPMPPADRMHAESGYMSSPERGRPYPPYPSPSPAVPPVGPPTGGGPPGVAPPYEDPYFGQYGATRSGSITPVIDEEASDSEMMDNSYSLYGGVKMAAGRPIAPPQSRPFPPTAAMPAAAVPYDATRIRVEHMERQLANLTGLVQKALTQGRPPPGGSGAIPGGSVPPVQPGVPDGAPPGNMARDYLQVPASSRDAYRNDDTYLRSDTKPPKLGKGRDKSVSFEKSVSFSDEPPDMSSPKQHSPQHAERDHRHKPAPPPKPVSLSPGQYEGRHIYRDLHLTPEMYNQLRVLQRKAKDLRQEVRNLRRMSQAQAHSVRETIRDTFIKIRAMLLTGGESWLHQQQIVDSDRVRVSREEELYKQEMLRLEKDLTELESTVEELRGNVINRKTRVNMSDVENMALILSKSSKTVADLKVRFPSLQDGMKSILSSEMEKVVREEKFLKEEPERLESALRRCKKLTGTLVTLKRLASVQEQRLPTGNSSIDARLSPTLNDSPPIPGVGNERSGSVSSSLGSPVSGSPGPNSKFLKVGRGATKP